MNEMSTIHFLHFGVLLCVVRCAPQIRGRRRHTNSNPYNKRKNENKSFHGFVLTNSFGLILMVDKSFFPFHKKIKIKNKSFFPFIVSYFRN